MADAQVSDNSFHFELQHRDPASGARAGILHTPHGPIETPMFMPVGTAGTVKGLHFSELEALNARIILGNTYHLYLRPGLDIIRAAGGLHGFNSWERPMLTDSGGYQVFSLAGRRKITEEGVVFRSHFDGSKHLFSPESVMDIERVLGADIMMAFDECPPWPAEDRAVREATERTHRWWTRCAARFAETQCPYGYEQALFPIVQGGTIADLRKFSAETLAEADAPGMAIGGLSVGEPAELMYAMTELVCGILPGDRPRYLMGVGTPGNILTNIGLGIDLFDCVMPSRHGRTALLFTRDGVMNMRNAKWQTDFSALDAEGERLSSPTSARHSKAYLHHLYRNKEMLGAQLGSLHNIGFYLALVREARERIFDGSFAAWRDQLVPRIDQRI